MYLRHLALRDFRSWPTVELELGPGRTVLIGPNGYGKTNIVEALWYCATLGSHRVATDAPLNAAQCAALARRVPLGLARTGTTGSLFSGDLFLALSTANDGPSRTGFPTAAPSEAELYTTQQLPWNRIDAFHAATVHAVEEAVLNALVVNETMTGRDGHRSPALPHDQLRALLPQQ